MRNRAYSTLDVKDFDEEKRIFTGIASTPEVDRVGDIVDPDGAKFAETVPLLLFHNSTKPVGHARLTKAHGRITFEASIPKIAEPGTLKDRVDEAWQSVKAGLIKGVSIGFRTLDDGVELMKNGALKFLKIEILELSLVPIPANASASIATIKSICADEPTASGDGQHRKQVGTPRVTGAVVRLAKKDAPTTMKTLTEQINDFQAKRTANEAERVAIMNAAAEKGETLDAAQAEKYDTLGNENKAIDDHIVRLRDLEASNKAAAVPVAGATPAEASANRGGAASVVSVKENLPQGMEFCRAVICKAAAFVEYTKGNPVSALEIAKQRYPDSHGVHKYLQFQKTAVTGGTTTDSNFASALLAPAQVLESDFLEYLRPRTVIGKFGTNGVPSLRRVPFNVTIQSQTTGASASWVGEGKPKPVTKFNTTSTTLLFTKIAAISVITEELARFSRPGAEGVVRDELARAVIARMDTDFVDPAKAVSSGVNPASITNGVTPLSSAGTSAANVLTDLQNLINPFALNNYDVSDIVLIMPNSLALVLSLMENSLGQPAFAGIGINGGTLRGIPVITSQYVASSASYGNMVLAVSASNIALADDGSVTVDASREASIQMDDAPTQDATAGTGASLVSMWQTNSIALRAERAINWKKLRSTAVTFMDDVNWGSIGSPV